MEEGICLGALLQFLGLNDRPLAIAVNQEIIPLSQRNEHQLLAGDEVELIQAVGGG